MLYLLAFEACHVVFDSFKDIIFDNQSIDLEEVSIEIVYTRVIA